MNPPSVEPDKGGIIHSVVKDDASEVTEARQTFKADERHRRKVEAALKNHFDRTDGTRPISNKDARTLKAKARELLVKGSFTKNNFETGWKLLRKGD